jgi:hypothetical protein
MKLEDALPTLRAGKRIRRESWAEGDYVRPYGKALAVRKTIPGIGPGEYVYLHGSDILADDWEVIK